MFMFIYLFCLIILIDLERYVVYYYICWLEGFNVRMVIFLNDRKMYVSGVYVVFIIVLVFID